MVSAGMGTILNLVPGIEVGMGMIVVGMVGDGTNICPHAAL